MGAPLADLLDLPSQLVACRPVIAGAVDAWLAAVDACEADVPSRPTVDQCNTAHERLTQSSAGALRPLLDDLADLLALAGYPAR